MMTKTNLQSILQITTLILGLSAWHSAAANEGAPKAEGTTAEETLESDKLKAKGRDDDETTEASKNSKPSKKPTALKKAQKSSETEGSNERQAAKESDGSEKEQEDQKKGAQTEGESAQSEKGDDTIAEGEPTVAEGKATSTTKVERTKSTKLNSEKTPAEAPAKRIEDDSANDGNAETNVVEATPDDTREETVDVVTIIGSQDKLERASGSAHRVSSVLLETQEHDDVHRVLKQVPGVYIRDEDGFGLRPNIGLRGAASDRSAKVSLMEDGVLMAPAPYSAPAAYYFPLTTRLNGLEVYKGPSAIKYGPNTIGGAVNFTTRASVPRGQKGSIDLAMGSFGAEKIHAHFGQGFRHFGYVLEGARIATNGFKELDGGGDTGFQKDDWMLKMHLKNSASASVFHRLELKLGLAREQSNETYLGLTEADFERTPYRRYAASQLGDMEWKRTQVKLHYSALIGDSIEFTTTLYRHDFTRAWKKLNGLGALSGVDIHDALRDPTNPRYRPFVDVLTGASEWSGDEAERIRIGTNDRSYVSQGIQSRLEWTQRFENWRNTLEIGVRAHHDRIRREHTEAEYDMIVGRAVRGTEDDFTRRNTGEAVAFSGYLMEELSWQERVIISPGLRIEHYEMALTDRLAQTPSTKNEETILLPGVGLWASLTNGFGILAGVHKGFSPVSPGQASDTRSETSTNYETGVRWQQDQFDGEIVGFFNQYQNLTGTCTQSSGCDPNDLDTQFNAGEARILGVESMLRAAFLLGGGVKSQVRATYTWTNAQFQTAFQSGFSQWGEVTKGDRFPYVPQHQASFGLSLKKSVFDLDVSTTYVSDMRDIAGQGAIEEAFLIPAHTVVDITGGFQPRKGTRIYAKCENALNERYIVSKRPFGARPGKPMQILVGLKQSL